MTEVLASDRPGGRLLQPRRKYRPGIRTVLLLVNLVVLVLPLGSLVFFRIYENQLVRETEGELIAQSAVVAALFRRAVHATQSDTAGFGRPIDKPPKRQRDEPYSPIPPRIDLQVAEVLPRRPDAVDVPEALPEAVRKLGAELTEVFLVAQRTTLAGFRLLDHRGVVIGGRFELGMSLAHVSEVKAAMSGRYVSVLRHRTLNNPAPPLASISRGTGVRIFTAFPIIEDGRLWGLVYMSRTPNNILRHMYASRDQFLFIGLGIVALTLILAWITSRTISSPVDALAAQARRMAEGDRTPPAPLAHYGTREVADLGQSFIEMAQAVEVRSNYLREFAGHVSHEFKTPLTAIRGAAEILGEHLDAMPPQEAKRFLANIIEDTDRLRRLVTRLLELARVDNLEPAGETIVLRTALDAIAAFMTSSEIKVVVSGGGGLKARISSDNLDILVRNLIRNAIQHNARHVRIAVESRDDDIRIAIADDGDGISEGNRAQIFKPFFTTRRDDGGTGLGLRIVTAIVAAHGGSIKLAPTAEKGATFLIRLPRVGDPDGPGIRRMPRRLTV